MKPLIAGIAVTTLFAGSVQVERPELLFTEGTIYVYKGESAIKGERNFKYTEYVKIDGITQSGIHVLSTGSMIFETEYVGKTEDPYIVQFACDTTNYYIHAVNFAMLTKGGAKRGDKAEGDSLIYPLRMKVGDTLPDAYSKSIRNYPSGTATTLITYKQRKVEAIDTLTLTCGTMAAYRITMKKTVIGKSSSSYTGKNESKDEETWTEWFTPQLGIVKAMSQSKSDNTTVVLESYSK